MVLLDPDDGDPGPGARQGVPNTRNLLRRPAAPPIARPRMENRERWRDLRYQSSALVEVPLRHREARFQGHSACAGGRRGAVEFSRSCSIGQRQLRSEYRPMIAATLPETGTFGSHAMSDAHITVEQSFLAFSRC